MREQRSGVLVLLGGLASQLAKGFILDAIESSERHASKARDVAARVRRGESNVEEATALTMAWRAAAHSRRGRWSRGGRSDGQREKDGQE